MPCSVCGLKGHNKRTCVVAKIEVQKNIGVPEDIKEGIIDYFCDEITDEVLANMFEAGLEVLVPGLGVTVKLGKLAWKIRVQ